MLLCNVEKIANILLVEQLFSGFSSLLNDRGGSKGGPKTAKPHRNTPKIRKPHRIFSRIPKPHVHGGPLCELTSGMEFHEVRRIIDQNG